jgi:hypothetical protein
MARCFASICFIANGVAEFHGMRILQIGDESSFQLCLDRFRCASLPV